MIDIHQNHAMMMAGFLNRIFTSGQASLEESSKRLFLLHSEVSNYFLYGRDMQHSPFIAVPDKMQPYFTQMNWSRFTLLPSRHYVFLECQDPKSNMLIFAIGFHVRRERQSIFCHEAEDVSTKRLNIRTFSAIPDSDQVILSNRNDYMMIPMRKIQSIDQMDHEMNAMDAEDFFDASGASGSVSVISLGQKRKK